VKPADPEEGLPGPEEPLPHPEEVLLKLEAGKGRAKRSAGPKWTGEEKELLPKGLSLLIKGEVLLIYRPRDGVRLAGIVEHRGAWYGRTRFRTGGRPHGPFPARDEALQIVIAEMKLGLLGAV